MTVVALSGDTQPSLFLEHFTVNTLQMNSCSSKVVLIIEWAFGSWGLYFTCLLLKVCFIYQFCVVEKKTWQFLVSLSMKEVLKTKLFPNQTAVIQTSKRTHMGPPQISLPLCDETDSSYSLFDR